MNVHFIKMENVLIVGDNNLPFYNDEGEVLFQNVITGNTFYEKVTDELINAFPRLNGLTTNDREEDLNWIDPSIDHDMEMTQESLDDLEDSANVTGSNKSKAYWTYDLTIVLINKYKVYLPLFSDSIHKGVEVWDMISNEFKEDGFLFTGTQCENRWKYIRGKYMKKKDNDSDSNTGGAYFNFAYFEEIDEILGKKPNVTPKYVSSSLKIDRPSKSRSLGSSSAVSLSPNSAGSPGSSVQSESSSRSIVQQNSNSVGSSRSLARSLNSPPCNNTDLLHDFASLEIEEEVRTVPSTKSKKEPWEQNVMRQDKYHREMIEMQRESLSVFKDVMFKIVEEFKKK